MLFENYESIIVAGINPRSGTSLMMDTLVDSNIPYLGKKHFAKRSMNPNGAYEAGGIVMQGVADIDKIRNKAVKMMPSALFSQINPITGHHISGTSEDILKQCKIILCVRDPREVADSQRDLVGAVKVAQREMRSTTPTRWLHGAYRLIVQSPDWFTPPQILIVSYYDHINDPNGTAERISNFIGHTVTSKVNKNLYRSKDTPWTNAHLTDGGLADKIYVSIVNGNMKEYKQELIEWYSKMTQESKRWIDTEYKTYRIATPAYTRSLRDSPEFLARELLHLPPNSVKKFFETVEYGYNQDGELYTIERPADLGPLTRNKVKVADGDEVTIEEWVQMKTIESDPWK